MLDSVSGKITANHTNKTFEFLLVVPSEPIVKSQRAWEIYGKLQQMTLPYSEVLRAMADMLDEAGL